MFILSFVESKKSNNIAQNDKFWKNKMNDCELSVCKQYRRDEAYNCVNNCTSVACYTKIYGANPLEDGEIDYERNRKFISCLRDEIKEQQREQRVRIKPNTFFTSIFTDFFIVLLENVKLSQKISIWSVDCIS